MKALKRIVIMGSLVVSAAAFAPAIVSADTVAGTPTTGIVSGVAFQAAATGDPVYKPTAIS
ncbi:hypothetical protein [Alicyclobacillus acidiphilus]|uniref:hypothetical protein n=1 Tax=Alicyclobacillus acidiphilus TaxID=182455 RepID=UPI00082EE8AF|nr:hypothetical protein [Alicyclobacillus acidiphilus]